MAALGGLPSCIRNPWKPLEEISAELEAERKNWNVALFEHEITRSRIILGVYYGHPDARATTARDLARLAELLQATGEPYLVAGDINISDEDDVLTPDEACWLDAHAWMAQREGQTPAATFFTKNAARRIDRIFIEPSMAMHMRRAYIDDQVYFPGHVAIGIELEVRNVKLAVQVSRPSLVKGKQADMAAKDRALQEALEATADVNWHGEIDEVYEQWSTVWESYLLQAYGHSRRQPRMKGRRAPIRTLYVSPLAPKRNLWMRRLSNMLGTIRRLRQMLATHYFGDERLWAKLTRASKPISARYGVPPLNIELQGQPLEVIEQVLDATATFYHKVLKTELSHNRMEAKNDFRIRLAMNQGINRTTSRLLRPRGMGLPKIFDEQKVVIAHPAEVIDRVQSAWSQYFQATADEPTEEWLREQQRSPPSQTSGIVAHHCGAAQEGHWEEV